MSVRSKARVSADPSAGRGCVVAFFAAAGLFCLSFVAAGALLFFFTSYRPLRAFWDARNWTPAECRIEQSAVESRSDSDGTTWRAAIRYSYELGGHAYQGDRVDFGLGGFSSDITRQQQVVDTHPVGSGSACLVNPLRPEESVLNRKLDASLLVITGVSLVVAGGGLSALVVLAVAARFKLRPPQTGGLRASQASSSSRPTSLASGERITLRAARGEWQGVVVFAGLWNGFLLLMLVPVLLTTSRGERLFVLLMFSPFVLVGLGLLTWAGYRVLKGFGPHAVFQLDAEPRLGARATVHWKIEGWAGKLERLDIRLEGLERARYTRGTDVLTDERVFHSQELVAAVPPQPMESGSVSLAIPARTMPSFQSTHNAIVWRIVVSGVVPRWPDVDERFEIAVQPGFAGARR